MSNCLYMYKRLLIHVQAINRVCFFRDGNASRCPMGNVVLSEKVCGDALLCVLEVLDRIEFAGEEVCDVENGKSLALGDEA